MSGQTAVQIVDEHHHGVDIGQSLHERSELGPKPTGVGDHFLTNRRRDGLWLGVLEQLAGLRRHCRNAGLGNLQHLGIDVTIEHLYHDRRGNLPGRHTYTPDSTRPPSQALDETA